MLGFLSKYLRIPLWRDKSPTRTCHSSIVLFLKISAPTLARAGRPRADLRVK